MKTRTIVLTVLVASGVLFVGLIVVCGGLLFLTLRSTDAALSPKIDALFAAIEDDAFGETYWTEAAPELRQVVTQEQYEQIGAMVKNRLGRLVSRQLTRFNMRSTNRNTVAEVAYSASFERGTGTIQASFTKVGGDWRLVSLRVNSPEFQKDFATKRCPYCDHPHSASAKFCPSCGKSLAPPEKSDQQEAPGHGAGTLEGP